MSKTTGRPLIPAHRHAAMSDTPGAVERLTIEANLRKERRDWARAHDAEDARLDAVLRQAREALDALVKRHGQLVMSGDCGSWDVEDELEMQMSRAALAAIDALSPEAAE